jgi:spoIIIJ-associated protein
VEQKETVVDVTGEESAGYSAAAAGDEVEAPASADGKQRTAAEAGAESPPGELADGERGGGGPGAGGPGAGGPDRGSATERDQDSVVYSGQDSDGELSGAPADDGPDGESEGMDGDAPPERSIAVLEQESEIAADYIEGLLDVADLDGDIDMDVEADRPLVSVVGATLDELVGPRGEVLEALQELTRLAVHRQTGVRSRIMLDVGGYRVRRRRELAELGRSAADEVARTGVARRLEVMTPFERKIVHDAVAAAGLRSESEGEEPDRRVVVFPVV